MAAITLVNQVPSSSAPSAEFRLSQANHAIARIGVVSGGRVTIPLQTGVPSYAVKAVTRLGNFMLTSNTLNISGASVGVRAQAQGDDGYFQLVQLPGTQPQAIVCENTWREPVQFTLQVPGAPMQIVTVVDQHNSVQVSTAQQWQAFAIANGITTMPVTITDPDAVITLTANADDSYSLTVAGSTPAQAPAPKAATKADASVGAAVIPVTSAA